MAQGEAALVVKTATRARPTNRYSLWRRIFRSRYYYLLLVPCFTLLIIFNYYPAFLALWGSIFTLDYGREGQYVGLQNFREMFDDPTFRASVRNVVALTTFGAVTVITVPVAVAEMIFRLKSHRAQYFFRIIMVWPAIVPGLVTLLLWQFIYDPTSGLLNAILAALGFHEWATKAWLADPDLALYALMGSSFPFVGGIGVLIYLAGLQNIPGDLFDAAALDGASGLRRFFSIDLPLIKGQIRLLLVLAIIDGLQALVGPLVLTNGGPIDATMVPGLYMYQQAFNYGRLGYASAIGVVVFIAVFALTILNMTLFREND
ncbi:MAG TPA: sugar ABC transporter permease [Thermomicrobiales bacterium]|jgi:raffinose/stachyose/melibiose transport system permease protein